MAKSGDEKGVHKSVLLNETIDGLDIQKGDTVVDATMNGGGHSSEVLKRFGYSVSLIGIDADMGAIERANKKIGKRENFLAVCENFRNLDRALSEAGKETADRFIFDLGLSSDQLESSGRGFSFKRDEPLAMTFKADSDSDTVTAERIVNDWNADSIAAILKGYGEETFGKKIAEGIEKARKDGEIKTTHELVEIIKSATPMWYHKKKTHPATKTFQALRIAANDEINALEEGLAKAFEHLSIGGRIAVISFHSIEDRVVKQFFRKLSDDGKAKLVSKKPIAPTRDEVLENPRSRSAKLRIIEKF
ncbi:MAG: 16S rRNA (cytosine(1402)-N(4))-methyltransferase RsmH [Patescibacteria group bacterium]